jgi:glycosyltransferase involved in cell wall biosynthesis
MLEALFIDAENVRLCPPKDPAAMTEAINELINCPALRSRLRFGVQRLMEQCFAADRIISLTVRILTDPVQSSIRTGFDREP